MIHSISSYSDVRILVLSRPADSVCTQLPLFLQSHGYAFSQLFTIYQVINQLQSLSDHETAILIARPVMLNRQAMQFITEHFPKLKIIGWCESRDNMSDHLFAHAAGAPIVQVSNTSQLADALLALDKSKGQQRHGDPVQREPAKRNSSDRLEYKLTDEELMSLLGAR